MRLSRARTVLLVVDLQERLTGAMPGDIGGQIVANTAILIQAAGLLGMPIVVTRQYPKGLGNTVPAIEDALGTSGATVHRFDKLDFSAAAAPEIAALLPKLGRDQWLVTGIEAHVCVYQTARDLVSRGYETHVVTDAVASRTKANWRIGIDLAARAGAIPTSTEVCVFDLLGRAGSEEFKALSKAIK